MNTFSYTLSDTNMWLFAHIENTDGANISVTTSTLFQVAKLEVCKSNTWPVLLNAGLVCRFIWGVIIQKECVRQSEDRLVTNDQANNRLEDTLTMLTTRRAEWTRPLSKTNNVLPIYHRWSMSSLPLDGRVDINMTMQHAGAVSERKIIIRENAAQISSGT